MDGVIEIKIPDSCYDCRMCHEVLELGGMVCLADTELRRTNYNNKPTWCPIKEK